LGTLSRSLAYWRFTLGLRRFLKQRITPEQARETIRQRMRDREARLLAMVRKGVFGVPHSPYLALLRQVGCELGDVERMVLSDGVEEALSRLYEAGVYVTFEEFKGRRPIVRNGLELPVRAADFDNPFLRSYYEGSTGGSTGRTTRIMWDLDHALAMLPPEVLTLDAHGFWGAPSALYRGVVPATVGVATILNSAVKGDVARKWFACVTDGNARVPFGHRLAIRHVRMMARLFGTRLPAPELVPLDNPGPVVDWMVETLRTEGRCVVSAFVSTALRVALAAAARGADLSGAAFKGSGEPPTPAKVRAITSTGAHYIPAYWMSEAGMIGAACANPADGNDLHLVKDCIALIQKVRQVPGWPTSVNAFCVTSLLPTSPKIALNVCADDFGLVERRSCGCPLEECGYTEHLREIRSYGKLTGEGVTLLNSHAVTVLEEALPARFGGSPLDYQLLEEEDERGFTRLSLLVSPRVQLADEQEAIGTVLDALSRDGVPAGTYWKEAGALRVRRAEPVWSAGGKFMPLCVAERLKQGSGRPPAP
jgi:hypothetical protein